MEARELALHCRELADRKKAENIEILDVRKRLEHILVSIESEMDVLQIEKRIRGRVKAQMEKSQREYYLNEQMKAIQKELGEMEDGTNEIAELEQKVVKAGMPKEASRKTASSRGVKCAVALTRPEAAPTSCSRRMAAKLAAA